MTNIKKALLLIFTPALGVFALCNIAQASIISSYPQDMEVDIGEEFIVEIRLDSEQQSINVVEATINYPPDLLEAREVMTGASFLSLWTEEPSLDQDKGEIRLVGGVPGGTIVVDSPFIKINFYAKAQGTAVVSLDQDSSNVFLNDGLGTINDLYDLRGYYHIDFESPYALNLDSPTHPKETQWYQANDIELNWEAREEALYSHNLTLNPLMKPDEESEGMINQAVYDDVQDGIYYFYLLEKLPGDKHWEMVGERRFLIDSTPPLEFTPLLGQDSNTYDGQEFVSFGTTDLVSGIDYYEVQDGKDIFSDVASPYVLKNDRKRELIFRVYDKAGNVRESRLTHETGFKYKWIILLFFGIIIVVVMLIIRSKKRK